MQRNCLKMTTLLSKHVALCFCLIETPINSCVGGDWVLLYVYIICMYSYIICEMSHTVQVMSHTVQVMSHTVQVMSHIVQVMSHTVQVMSHTVQVMSHTVQVMSHTVQVMSVLCTTGNVGNYILHLWFYLLVDVKFVTNQAIMRHEHLVVGNRKCV